MSKLIDRILGTITAGTSTTNAIKIDGKLPRVLQMSVDWTAADLCFAGTGDGLSWYFIYNETGVVVSAITDKGHRINLPETYLKDNLSIKICSGTPASPVNQVADRLLYIELWED